MSILQWVSNFLQLRAIYYLKKRKFFKLLIMQFALKLLLNELYKYLKLIQKFQNEDNHKNRKKVVLKVNPSKEKIKRNSPQLNCPGI